MSASAAAQLDAAGFHDVRVLRGGMERWIALGLEAASRDIAAKEARL
jgi:rhodanese-related sulfurtransferase